MLTMTERMLELQIVGLAMRIRISLTNKGRILQHFSTVGIDAHAYYPALSVVDIKRDAGLGAGGDIADPHVVKEEGRTNPVRQAD